MSWTERNFLRTIGYALIILGILLILFILISASIQTQYPPCPYPGCAYNVPLYGPSLFLGLALIIIGIVLLLAARKMKPDKDADS